MKRALVLSLIFCGCAYTFPARYDLESLRADSARWPGHAPRLDARRALRRQPGLGAGAPAAVDCLRAAAAAFAPSPFAAEFIERLSRLVITLIERPEPARLRATYDVLTKRPREPAPALRKLRLQLPARASNESLNTLVESLSALLDLDDGIVNGEPLTEATVLQLDDEALLRRIDARAPEEALRIAARRRIVRNHLAQSTLREVKARAAEVEAAVMANGRWAQGSPRGRAPWVRSVVTRRRVLNGPTAPGRR